MKRTHGFESESLSRFFLNSLLGAVGALSFSTVPNGVADMFGWNLSDFGGIVFGLILVGLISLAIVKARVGRSLWYGVTIGYLYSWLSLIVFHRDSIIRVFAISPLLLPVVIVLAPLHVVVAGLIGAILGRRYSQRRTTG